jgi:diacylglycerol O-acyltransferase
MTIVDGLEGGRVAFVMKLHHAIADGVASVAMLENAFVADSAHAVEEPFRPEPLPSSRQLYQAAATGAARAVRSMPRAAVRTVAGARQARAVKQSVTALLPGPFTGPRTPFNVALSSDRTFSGIGIPLEVLLAAKKTAGASLNDAFLALCAGAIRRYLGRLGALPSASLITSVPMATRTDLHRLGGNHVDNIFLPSAPTWPTRSSGSATSTTARWR